jgi:hypothetical protein
MRGSRRLKRYLRCLLELLQVLHFSGFTEVKSKLLLLGVSRDLRLIPLRVGLGDAFSVCVSIVKYILSLLLA